MKKPNGKLGEFRQNETTTIREGKSYTYYERAMDREGNWLKIGDGVRVISNDDGQKDLRGLQRKIIGIFEGDLMLQNEVGYDYCWPKNTVRLKK